MAKSKNTMVRDAIVLCVITLIAGLLVAFFHDLTAEPIARNEQLAKEAAYKALFEEAVSFPEAECLSGTDAETFGAEALAASGKEYGIVTVDAVIEAKDASDTLLGYIVTVTTGEGYGGDIVNTVGISTEGKITGVEILSISETAGLGMKAKEESFRSQYTGKNETFFEVTKSEPASSAQIQALSGATITSRAMTNSVNAALQVANYIFEQ